ncbi:MAG: FAD-dependent oxidoreductase [Clostridia bacterium]|nr:FAD-dependent oxidoreductase [Clostridia bacterium]
MKYDVVVIGGGPAGMSAGVESSRNGAKTLIIERNPFLGGILKQCIHNGFGLHYFKEEFTGPEYAQKFIELVNKEKNLDVLTNTFVTKIDGTNVEITTEFGKKVVEAKALVLAMGCRERTAGNILLTGSRPSGIFTAGEAQRLVNIQGKLPGKNVVVLGSGDIGLVMARRLTLQGASVKAVLEINPTTSGLRRNIVQCLEDFNIPLLLKTTIFEVVGKNRVEGVYYGSVDERYNKIEATKKFLPCDTIILSVGLVPETDLIDMQINPKTKSVFVNDYLQSEKEGVFVCGNVLHVHDLVDNVSMEGALAGKNASDYALNRLKKGKQYALSHSTEISYTVPTMIHSGEGTAVIKFRVRTKITKSYFVLKNAKGEVVAKKYVMACLPGEMQTFEVDRSLINSNLVLEVAGL